MQRLLRTAQQHATCTSVRQETTTTLKAQITTKVGRTRAYYTPLELTNSLANKKDIATKIRRVPHSCQRSTRSN